MGRFVLINTQWEGMRPFCLGKPTDPRRTGSDATACFWKRCCGSSVPATYSLTTLGLRSLSGCKSASRRMSLSAKSDDARPAHISDGREHSR